MEMVSDDTARTKALQQMREEMRDLKGEWQSEDVRTAMDEMRAACGGTAGMYGMGMRMKDGMGIGRGRGEKGQMHEKMLTILGMTQDEFEAALETGKTPHDIAEEKGIELPMGGVGGRRGWGMMMQKNGTGLRQSEVSDQ